MRNGTQRLRRSVALATAIVALAASAASAAPIDPTPSSSAPAQGNANEQSYSSLNSISPYSAQEQSYSSVNSISPYTPQSSPSSSPTTTSGDGFDWGDAGIGATAILALTAMVGGAALVLRNRPQRRPVA